MFLFNLRDADLLPQNEHFYHNKKNEWHSFKYLILILNLIKNKNASAGNRTRVDSLEGYNSTTKPPMLTNKNSSNTVLYENHPNFLL